MTRTFQSRTFVGIGRLIFKALRHFSIPEDFSSSIALILPPLLKSDLSSTICANLVAAILSYLSSTIYTNLDALTLGDDPSDIKFTRAEGVALGAAAGAATGGLLTLAGGLGALFVPGIGLALAAESVLAVILGSGAAATADGLIGALQGWFIPEEQARFYNHRVS